MRRIYIATVILAVTLSLLAAPAFADKLRVSDRVEVPESHLVGLRIDPVSSVIRVAPRFSRDVINSSFDFVSATCTDCGDPCPLIARSVEVLLQANTAVAAGYGVSGMTSANYTVTSVGYSRQDALTAGETITVTITGDVLDCGNWFNVFFSMCDSPQADPHTACLDEPREMTLLHSFAGGADDGQFPISQSMLLDGSTLYGMTFRGGDSDFGVIFSINTDGTGHTLLHELVGGVNDGKNPYGSLAVSGSTLYGMTFGGGDSDLGAIFSINTDGTGHRLLHEFAGGVDDGRNPYGSLAIDGSALYGMTYSGGDADYGVIFSISSDGTGFTLLHEFSGGVDDGFNPIGSLVLDDSTLYGMTLQGGDSDYGVVFSINTDGTDYTLLHEFTGGPDAGRTPYGSLVFDGSTLYGMTRWGGDSNPGVIFSINTNGTGFTLLHEFAGGSNEGREPIGSLALDGSTLYGMTLLGGDSGLGTIFSINTNGNWYELLHEFLGFPSDAGEPQTEGPLVVGNGIYGMASNGGSADRGAIFKLE